jgi:hypothetical protein
MNDDTEVNGISNSSEAVGPPDVRVRYTRNVVMSEPKNRHSEPRNAHIAILRMSFISG